MKSLLNKFKARMAIKGLKTDMKNRKGFTLVEVLLVLAVATAIITIGLRIYSSVQENTKLTQAMTDIGQVRGAVESLYQGQGSFTGLVPANLATTLPKSLFNTAGTAMVNAFGGVLDVGPATITTSGDSYYVGVTNLDATACTRLSTTDFGRSMVALVISASNAATADPAMSTTNAIPMTPVTAAAACSSNMNSVSLQFH